ncbi:response regulator [Paraburkholderia phytofirmans]|uniref:response regulator n=1 Tax=Paraburkholderia phytofirmans TaxID=261302 RepID=UPI0038BD3CA6
MKQVHSHHLLIADDDPALLAAYVQYFELHGYEIRATRDGADALSEYCRWFPAVVILDVQMPRLDGREVARKIRGLKGKPIPLLVAVSGLSSQYERAASLRSGFDHHFAKPAQLPVILSAIALHSRTQDPDIAQVQRRR